LEARNNEERGGVKTKTLNGKFEKKGGAGEEVGGRSRQKTTTEGGLLYFGTNPEKKKGESRGKKFRVQWQKANCIGYKERSDTTTGGGKKTEKGKSAYCGEAGLSLLRNGRESKEKKECCLDVRIIRGFNRTGEKGG